MFKEVNTATNLPAQIDLYATPGDYYKFLFMAKVCVFVRESRRACCAAMH